MGGGSNSSPPSDTPPGGGIYRTDTENLLSGLGQGIQKAGAAYGGAIAQSGQSQSQRNYNSGSGSPWLGGGQSMSADQPVSYNIPQTPPNQVSDFQKQYYDIVGKIYQSYQQRVMNEGFGQGQLGI